MALSRLELALKSVPIAAVHIEKPSNSSVATTTKDTAPERDPPPSDPAAEETPDEAHT